MRRSIQSPLHQLRQICSLLWTFWTMITYDYKSLIRTGKFSTHYFGGSLLPTLLPRRSRFSNVNIGVNIEEKVERINTSCYPDHIDEQNHLYLYLLHWRKYQGEHGGIKHQPHESSGDPNCPDGDLFSLLWLGGRCTGHWGAQEELLPSGHWDPELGCCLGLATQWPDYGTQPLTDIVYILKKP